MVARKILATEADTEHPVVAEALKQNMRAATVFEGSDGRTYLEAWSQKGERVVFRISGEQQLTKLDSYPGEDLPDWVVCCNENCEGHWVY